MEQTHTVTVVFVQQFLLEIKWGEWIVLLRYFTLIAVSFFVHSFCFNSHSEKWFITTWNHYSQQYSRHSLPVNNVCNLHYLFVPLLIWENNYFLSKSEFAFVFARSNISILHVFITSFVSIYFSNSLSLALSPSLHLSAFSLFITFFFTTYSRSEWNHEAVQSSHEKKKQQQKSSQIHVRTMLTLNFFSIQ